jgi:uncharacterized protein YjiS (DUF1127 family)
MRPSIVHAPAREAGFVPAMRAAGPPAAEPPHPEGRHDARWRLRRRDARLLASLGDSVLDDVGLTRADVQAVAGAALSQRWWE